MICGIIPPDKSNENQICKGYFLRSVRPLQVRMMDKLALEMERFEETIGRFEVDIAQAKQCGDFTQMVSEGAP